MNALTDLSADVDRRLGDQLGRRAELESLNVLCQGVASQLADAQQKLAALNAAQEQLEPTVAQIAGLKSDLEAARSSLQAVRHDEQTLAVQERRLADLAETSRQLSGDVTERADTVQRLLGEVDKAVRSRRSCSATWRRSRAASARRSRSSKPPKTSSSGSTRCGRRSTNGGHSSKKPNARCRGWKAA